MEITPLPLTSGMIARTRLDVDGNIYELTSCRTQDSIDSETYDFWKELLQELPYETVVYKLVDAQKPLTPIELKLSDMISVDTKYRRDLELGDLYVKRSKDEETCALEHQDVIEQFKDNSILLFTQEERNAIYGPNKML